MTTTERIHEIVSAMTSFPTELIHKSSLQAELLKLQEELVTATYNGNHAENAKLRVWDVVNHLKKLNEEREYVADEELAIFVDGCKLLSNAIHAEITGNAGERKAARSLEIVQSKKHVLRNIEFKSDDRRTELDFIVFTEKAIFIIEVKNPQKDIYIDERGNYCRVSDEMHFDKNIGENMNDKTYLLRQALSAAGYESLNIQSMVLFTNNKINVDNHFEHIQIAFLSDLPHKIEKYNGANLYTDVDIAKMVECVTSRACKESYPLPFDIDKFKYDFATLVAKLEGYSFEIEPHSESITKTSVEQCEDTDAIVSQIKMYRKKPNHINLAVIAAVGAAFSAIALIASSLYRTAKR